MGCLLVLLAAFAPRLIVVFAWIARPVYFDSVFDSWIFPLLGLIFLPFTTLMWLLVGAPPQGVAGWDWLWIVLAAILTEMNNTVMADAPELFVVHDLNPRALSPKLSGFVQAQSWFQDLTPIVVNP